MTERSIAVHAVQPSCAGRTWPGRPGRTVIRILGLAAVLGLGRIGCAAAFPLIDSSNLDQVPVGTELSPPDAQDLRHQLQIVNGLGAPASGGWTFVPRIDYQEMLTDNVLEQHSPRQTDLVSYLSPGFSLVGDMPRVSLNLSYAPTLAIYAREGSLDALTHQLNGIGLVTVVPDLAFVDIRATAGVHNAFGGVGGAGGIGATDAATAQSAIPSLSGNAQGLTRNNEVQTASIGVSPYLLGHFGDWGTGKLGDSLNITRSNALSGFLSAPFPTGGVSGQTLVSNEENAHFISGDILQQFQDSVDIDLLQSQTTTDANSATLNGSFPASGGVANARRVVLTDQLSYKLNRSFAVFVSGGHEDITYSDQFAQSSSAFTIPAGSNGALAPTVNSGNFGEPAIHDLTWSLGATWTPNPDSQLTVSYGHQNGFNSASANGHYTLTGRTLLTLSYGSTLGTQLEYLQSQLNLATPGTNGTLVNGQTGGQLFGSTNALAVQNGVFRTDTLTAGTQTILDRDIITLSLLMTKQTSSSGAISSTATAKTFGATWVHQMQPDMTLNAGFSFSIQDQSVSAGINPGNSTSVVASLGWQYQISDTVSTSLRYSFFERQAAVVSFDFYQNMLILGISKTF